MRNIKFLILASLAFSGVVRADDVAGRDPLRHGLFFEQASSPLKRQGEYDVSSLIYRFSFPLSRHCEFNLEPRVGYATSPEKTYQFAVPLMLRFKQPVSKKATLFIEGGSGPMYLEIDTYEQSDGLNFLNRLGAGVSYRCSPRLSVEVGGHWQHISNAHLNDPNGGINGCSWFAGVNWSL